MIALLLLACTHKTLPSGLYGHPPAAPVPLPTFTATNRDGALRGPDALIGHPTVVWFYPAADTPG